MHPEGAAASLDGIRVIDATGVLGSYAGRLLGDLGADVIRVVPPGGDPLDAMEPFLAAENGVSTSAVAYFFNLNKRTVTLDLEQPEGRELFVALLARSDILIESWSSTEASSLSLGPDALRADHPRLVHVSVTPFGRTGPRAAHLADDLVTMAAGGLLSLGGYPDAEPVVAYGNQSGVAASIFAAVAALLGILARGEGDGEWFDVSAQEAVTAALEDAIPLFDLTGRVKRRAGDRLREAGSGILPCADGYISMIAGRIGTARAWRALVEWLIETDTEGAEELREEQWQTLRHRQLPESTARFSEIFGRFAAGRTKAELYEEAQRRNIALAPVNEIGDLFDDPQLQFREFFNEFPHPLAGSAVLVPGHPYRLASASSHHPFPSREHRLESRHVLETELGLSASRLDELSAAGVL